MKAKHNRTEPNMNSTVRQEEYWNLPTTKAVQQPACQQTELLYWHERLKNMHDEVKGVSCKWHSNKLFPF